MQSKPDAGRFVSVLLIASGALVAIAALGLWGDATGTVWLVLGAACATLAMIGATLRLGTASEANRKELKFAEVDIDLLNDLLSEAEEQLDELANSIPGAVFICHPSGEILFCNQAAVQDFDFPEPVGKTILQVTLSMDLQQSVTSAVPQMIAKESEILLSHPQERVLKVKSWRPDPIAERVYLSLTDITSLRQMERVRSDFVANASHELRTPMAAIRSMAETLIEATDQPEKQKSDYLRKIIVEVDRLTNLSNDLLVLSSAESRPAQQEPLEFVETVRYAFQELEPQARNKGLSLSLETPESAPVLGDDEQLVQVVLNLLSNAIRYSQEGTIYVKLKIEEGFVVLSVSDSGIGIASEHLPRIFERFYRIDRARSRETGGTGLGLSIVRHIVEAHGGRIEVESELNVGSTFRVFLPSS